MMLWEITVADGLHCKAKHVLKLSQCLSAQKSQGVCNFYNFLYLFLAAGNDMTLEPKHNVVKHEKNVWIHRFATALKPLTKWTIQCFAGKPWFLSGFCILLRHVSLSSTLLQTNQTARESFTRQWRWKRLRSTIFKGPDPDSKPPSLIWHLLDASQINGGAILETDRYFRSHRLCHRAEHHTTGQSCFGATKVI